MENLSDQFNKNQLISEFKEAVADAEALLKATAHMGDDKLSKVRAKAEESLSIAKATMKDAQAELVASTKAAVKATDVYVQENPWRSVGLATCVGAVIGLLVARR